MPRLTQILFYVFLLTWNSLALAKQTKIKAKPKPGLRKTPSAYPYGLGYRETLEKYTESFRLEWRWGLGVELAAPDLNSPPPSSSPLQENRGGPTIPKTNFVIMPVSLEFQFPFWLEDGSLRALAEIGALFKAKKGSQVYPFYSQVYPFVHIGLRYHWTEQFYSRFVGGTSHSNFNELSGGLFFGWSWAGMLGIELGLLQFYYFEAQDFKNHLNWGVAFQLSQPIKKWWGKRKKN